jgi:aspartate aminotransferase-like enzyme
MGNISHREIISTIAALEMALKEFGYEVELGSGVAAVQETYMPGNNTLELF